MTTASADRHIRPPAWPFQPGRGLSGSSSPLVSLARSPVASNIRTIVETV